jgi:Icc-related predicted phosphoesterase
MKILLVSDEESKYIWDYFEPEVFRGVELILSCGDLRAEYLSFLVSMIPAPLFYVPGNHDKNYLVKPPEGCESIDGTIVNYKGIRFFGLGGCKSMHKAAFEYTEEDMKRIVRKKRRLLHKFDGFDIFVTHAPALGVGDGDDSFHQGFQVFKTLVDTYQPRYHFYGHLHSGYARVRTKIVIGRTTFINAFGYRVMEI